MALPPTATGAPGTITEFPIPANGEAKDITAGPDGNLWFTERSSDKIGRITPGGTITEFPISANGGADYITAGPDGNIWFTMSTGWPDGRNIGRIDPADGTFTKYPVPSLDDNDVLLGITAGPDGNLWFIKTKMVWGGSGGTFSNGEIYRITPDGTITEYPLKPESVLWDITAGPDGNLWFTDQGQSFQPGQPATIDKIGRITPGGTITEYPLKSDASAGYITAGPDGNLWFASEVTPFSFGGGSMSWPDMFGRITPGGTITYFPLRAPSQTLIRDITAGPDGNLWFTEEIDGGSGDKIGRITPSGKVTVYPVPTGGVRAITAGPDGNIWFIETNKIARLVPPGPGCRTVRKGTITNKRRKIRLTTSTSIIFRPKSRLLADGRIRFSAVPSGPGARKAIKKIVARVEFKMNHKRKPFSSARRQPYTFVLPAKLGPGRYTVVATIVRKRHKATRQKKVIRVALRIRITETESCG